jgi:hypothetical protein
MLLPPHVASTDDRETVRQACEQRRPYGQDMDTSDGGSGHADKRELTSRSRRWFYSIAAIWLILAVLAVAQWLFADDSKGRWLAGIQCFIGLVLGIAYLVQAKRGRRW